MEAEGLTEGTQREARRAAVCFVLLTLWLALGLYLTPNAETLMRSLGCLAAAIFAFTLMRRNRGHVREDGSGEDEQRPRSRTSTLFGVMMIILASVLLVYLFDAFLADFVREVVPATVSGPVQGVFQGGGAGIIIYSLSDYSGSYRLNQEERKESLRSLKIAMVVVVSLLLLLVGVYVAIEYVLGPVIRYFA